MKGYRRWMAAILTAAAAAVASVHPGLALPAAEPFADFHIGAQATDAPQRIITVARYRQNAEGEFLPDGTEEIDCKLNRLTGDASLYIHPNTDGVWATVDHLTDLNGDGIYELLEGGDIPAWDAVDSTGTLSRARAGQLPLLSGQEPCILSAQSLLLQSRQAVQDRTEGGSQALDVGRGTVAVQEFPVCRVTLHHSDPADGQEYEQVYYLRIYQDILVPFDVTRDAWYYDAVIFCLSQRYFDGMGEGLFSPDSLLSRAQLAKVLWTVSSSPIAFPTSFTDVSEDDWFYPAVSWCQQMDLINGCGDGAFAPYDQLTREQLASILYRYARHSGSSLRASANLSDYSDGGDVSPWAYESMRWAVGNRLISDSDNAILPGAPVSRAELAQALYSYDLYLGLSRER